MKRTLDDPSGSSKSFRDDSYQPKLSSAAQLIDQYEKRSVASASTTSGYSSSSSIDLPFGRKKTISTGTQYSLPISSYGSKVAQYSIKLPEHGLPSSVAELEQPYLKKPLPPELFDPLVYAIQLTGLAVVMTWTVCIMSVDDFHRALPDQNAEFKLAASYKTSVCVMGILLFGYGAGAPYRCTIIFAFSTQILCVCGMIYFVIRKEGILGWITLFAIAGCAQACAQHNLCALCSAAPERYLRALMVGLAMGTVVGGSLKLATKGFIQDPFTSEFIWIGEICVIYLMAIVIYVKVIDKDATLHASASVNHNEEANLNPFSKRTSKRSSAKLPEGHDHPLNRNNSESSHAPTMRDTLLIPIDELPDSRIFHLLIPKITKNTRSAFQKGKFWYFLMMSNWIITMIVFPGITSDLSSNNYKFQKSGWYHIVLFFVFLLADVVGRMSTGIEFLRRVTPGFLLGFSCVRILLIPALLIISLYDGVDQGLDSISIFTVIAVGLSNGYAISMCALDACANVSLPERPNAGTLIFVSYISGQSIGVLAALVMKSLEILPDF